jgi:pimeloyl-ACP methyl ester carboxylesterase
MGLQAKAQASLPCLFIKGESSDYILEIDNPIIKHHFPNAEQALIPKAGHWLHAENPSEFYNLVNEFIV